MARIHLRSVLAEIDTPDNRGQAREFSLKYATADGEERFRQKVRKAGSLGGAATHATGKFRYNIKQKGLLLIVDVATGENRSLKIGRLIEYNGVRILHG